uniref:proline-rich receptor-like protein kinase PERK2 n=1 Tax=Halichoerus grypus TaxID=9711 RepID=UPI001658C4AD|nr:proline-rich receptor-like protein kinase PERK2 [Halichoerus grypus]
MSQLGWRMPRQAATFSSNKRLLAAFLPSSWTPEPGPQGPPPHASLPHSCHPPASFAIPFQQGKKENLFPRSHQPPAGAACLPGAPAGSLHSPPCLGAFQSRDVPLLGCPPPGLWCPHHPPHCPSSLISSDRTFSPLGLCSMVPTPAGLPPLCPASSVPPCKAPGKTSALASPGGREQREMSGGMMWAQEREVKGVGTIPPGPSHDDSWGGGCPAPSLLGPHASPESQASCIISETAPALLSGWARPRFQAREAVPHRGLWFSAWPQFSHGPRKRFHGPGTESLGELQVNFHILTQDIPSSSWRWLFLALNTFQGLHALAPSLCPTRRPQFFDL